MNRRISRYKGGGDFPHRSGGLGILLANLGTPSTPTPAAVRRYLAEFLWDPRVVELPRWLWWFILHGVVLRVRPSRSAHAYQKVWTVQGSPLLAIGRRQAAALQDTLRSRLTGSVTIALGMRYGDPSIATALEELRRTGIHRLLVLPLYPQYAGATTGATFDAVAAELRTWRRVPELRMVGDYHSHVPYLEALAQGIREAWAERERPDQLLFSFHGLPQRVVDAGDPYSDQCRATAQGVAERLELAEGQWAVSFQSRFGREEWVRPYTDQTLREWAVAGVRSVDIICPGFAADCLETLEEVALQNRDLFLMAGGKTYHYLPALNDRSDHILALAELILAQIQGWPEAESVVL
ncbi:Ferrochelatase [Gammaproteobacteria bacterium]